MNKLKRFLHYCFGKHEWVYYAKGYNGNNEIGHKESCYYFRCDRCGKYKKVEVKERI